MIEVPTGEELELFSLKASFDLEKNFVLETTDVQGNTTGEVDIAPGVYTPSEFISNVITIFQQQTGVLLEKLEVVENDFRLRFVPQSGQDDFGINVNNFESKNFKNEGGGQLVISFNENPITIPLITKFGTVKLTGSNVRYLQDWRIFQEGEFLEGFKEGTGGYLYNTRGRLFFRYMYVNEDSRRQVEHLLFNGQGYGGELTLNEETYDVSFASVADTADVVDDISLGGKQAIDLEIFPRG